MFKKKSVPADFFVFSVELFEYFKKKILLTSNAVEHSKNWVVKRLLWRRGLLSRPITHVSLVAFAISVVFIGVSFGRLGVFATSSAAAKQELATKLTDPVDIEVDTAIEASYDPNTQISDKPRDKIFEHTVDGGETISTIAQKYGVDVNTVKWANELSDTDKVKPGQKLKILPITGVAHEVKAGDTIYTVAEKYKANPQAVADLYSNYIDESLTIQVGQILVIPDGVPPTKPAPATPAPRYVAQGKKQTAPVKLKQGADDRNAGQKEPGGSLGFVWPFGGRITQYRTGYHTGLDIAGPMGKPIVAAGGGRVVTAIRQGVGYGYHIIIDNGNGYQTLYAHMSRLDVSVGQSVSRGQQIGLNGSTGRSTGPHVHFEVRKGGAMLNPLTFLK